MSVAAVQVEEARFLLARTGKTKVLAFTIADLASTDLSTLAGFEHIGDGKFIAMITTQDVQFAFGDSAVTISANDPYLPAGTMISGIPQGTFIGLKAFTTGGNLYIWPAS